MNTLGLDLGTNSIGWAIVDNKKQSILGAGSRIIPMDAGLMGDFERGNSIPFTADRTKYRGMRRMRERFLLRRERLLRVLRLLDFLPEHYASQLTRHGHLPADSDIKLAWRTSKDGKPHFLFLDSFLEMVDEFRRAGHDRPLPYDWTIYYLRHKALSHPITKQELSWILMQFNQKRGYNQLRGKDNDSSPDDAGVEREYHELRVVSVEDTGETRKGGGTWFNITLENGWVYRRPCRIAPDWVGSTRPFVATFKLDKDGRRKEAQPSLSAPKEDDWGLRKIRTQQQIEQGGFTVGDYIYHTLLHNPDCKIIGDHVQTVDRTFYRDELHRILDCQRQFHPELCDRELYATCVEELYPNNDAHRRNIANRDFTYLLADDILLYQRPLKSKRSLIADCPYEQRAGRPVKCIAKSHPLFQEFRLWQFLTNLRLYNGDDDVTATLIPNHEAWATLYNWLATQKQIDQKSLLRHLGISKKEESHYRWNYQPDRTFPCGETRAVLLAGLSKAGIDETFLTPDKELHLWHLLYSVDDQQQYRQALRTFAHHQGWNQIQTEAFAKAFDRLTVCKEKDYGAYSAKALNRLLPLMRRGHHWRESAIDTSTRQRIEHIINGEVYDNLSIAVRERFNWLNNINQCQGLPTWQACYLVYGRHSEASDSQRWQQPEDIDRYLSQFRRNSLNNPIVERVVMESLRVVRDVWRQYGRPDEVHIELGRELKKTKAEREALSAAISDGEATNQRIRLLLAELMNPDCQVEAVRPHSPSQHELLKIYEEGVLNSGIDVPDDIQSIRSRFANAKNLPSHAEVLRYKLWIDQKYISPYTGRPIPLGKLFTTAYQIEHVIPQSRWFDDSMSNKVICEAEVNRLKDRQLGLEFIQSHHGERVPLSLGGSVEILSVEAYRELVNRLFATNRHKRQKLLMDEIPADFNARQLNDSRYISRLMMQLMSNLVRAEDEEGKHEDAATSKNVVVCNGQVTDRLKRDWGVNDVWNRIILPRFERLNALTHSTDYTTLTAEGHLLPTVPLDMRQGFNRKRIDHRHHAMDAIVIACCTRDHVNLLSNEASKSDTVRYDLQHKLRTTEKYIGSDGQQHTRFAGFRKPWDTFNADMFTVLQSIIVSFKQNLRVINKTSNRYTVIKDGKHVSTRQTKGDSWAIRKPMHKETVFGEVNLQLKKRVAVKKALADPNSIVNRELKAIIKAKKALHYTDKQIVEFLEKNKDVWSEAADGKIEVYYYTADTSDRYFATRKSLLSVMDGCTTTAAAEKAIASITDSGIRSILLAHLSAEGGNAAEAFSADGLERMNANMATLNGGHPHLPIKKVRVFEQANKFSVGHNGQKATKFVEAAKGTNLFFAIFTNRKGERGYATVPLNIVTDLQKQYERAWRDHLADRLQSEGLMPANTNILYILSPGDLVYVPHEGELITIETIDRTRIYRLVSVGQTQFMCLHYSIAFPIVNKMEFTTSNKMERALTGEMIKEVCIPIVVDRLGNITQIGQPV